MQTGRSLASAALVALLLALPLAGAHTPGYWTECHLEGTLDATGRPVAPPCVEVTAGTETYYVFLLPDRDGDLANGMQSHALVWKESNGCPGLQRVKTVVGSGRVCAQDTRVS